MTKYLKTWTGLTTGTLAGRDDGHPITKYKFFNSFDDLLKTHGSDPDEKYFKLVDIQNEVEKEIYKDSKEIELAKKKRRLQMEIDKVITELESLNSQ